MSEPLPVVEETERPERCETCRWWDCIEPGGTCFGRCRRHPPGRSELRTFPEGYSAYVGIWVETEDTDWCGEWRAKGATPNPVRVKTIESLNLSVRARKAVSYWAGGGKKMARHPVLVGHLLLATPDELLQSRMGGLTVLAEVRQALAAHGLHLKGDTPPE